MKLARTSLIWIVGLTALGVGGAIAWTFLTPGIDRSAAAEVNGPAAANELAGQTASSREPIARTADEAAPRLQDGESVVLRLTSCLSNPLDDERQLDFLNQLSRMRAEDAAAFLQALIPFREQGVRGEEWSAFFRKWGEVDPHSAIAYLEKNKEESWAQNSYQQVLRSWAVKDKGAAQAWLNEHADEPYFMPAMLGFLDGYATWDTKGATETALASLSGAQPQLVNAAMEKIAHAVFRSRYADGLKEWFDDLPSEGDGVTFRSEAMRHVYSRLLQKDPAVASEWIAAQSFMPWRNDGIIAGHAVRLAAKDPAAAMAWVASMPPSPKIGVVMGVGEIVHIWQHNPATFEPWLETVRGTQVFEQAARDYAIEVARRDPAKSMFWAKQVTNPHWRGEALRAAEAAAARR